MIILSFVVGLVFGALIAFVMVARDKNLVMLKEDQIIVKRKELDTVIKGYTMAVKKIDPDLASEI